MARYKYLEFFTKNGNSCNFDYDEELERWEGDLYIPKISSNLFETEHLFIYERMFGGDTEYYAKPHIYDYDNSASINLEWEDDTTPELTLYEINSDKFINKLTTVEIELDYSSSDYRDANDQLHADLITKEYIQVNVAVNSEEEGLFENYLLIKDKNDNHIIAKIYIYGEVEGEDERLEVLCNNLGYFITPEEEKIFTDSDIEEDLKDLILLNRKRKEILLEGSNIFPFVGAYKGLINAINFFGFTDLTVREYWKNVNIESKNYGKYKQSEVLEIFNQDVNFNAELVDSKHYRKTNRIALVYQLYDVYEDRLDAYELPTVEENFRYTLEEVLIKLYSLKKVLQRKFLPHSVDIQDIIAEGTYFSKLNRTYTLSNNTALMLDKGVTPKLSVLSTNDEILDLRDLDELIFQYEFDPYFEHDIRNRLDETQDEWGEYIVALFTKYYPTINTLENLPDKDDIPIGCPVVLRNSSFDFTIKELDAMIKEFNSDNDYVIDFEIKNPLIGDTYILEETESNTKVQYNVTVPISEDDLTVELYNLVVAQTQLPWVLFLPSIIEKNSKKYLRLEAKDISTNKVLFDFKTYVYDGLNNEQFNKFNKHYITLSNSYTMKNIGAMNYYEIEWRVYKDDLSFDYTIRGSLAEYETLAIVLTKEGLYNVDMKLYNTNNKVTRKLFKDFIDVKMKACDFLGVYRRISDKYDTIKSLENIKYNENKLTSIKPLIVQETKLKDCDITFDTLNRISLLPNTNYRSNFLYTVMNFRPNQDISFPGPFTFAAIGKDTQIKDFKYITNRWTMLSGDTPASFDILEVNIGGVLVIKDLLTEEKGSHIFHTDDLKTAVDELNDSVDPIISKYVYGYVDNDEGYFVGTFQQSYVHAAGKFFGKNSDFKAVEFENIEVDNIELSRDFGYQVNDFEILNNFRAFKGVVYIQFAPDNSGIPGKKFYKWVIRNVSDEDFADLYFFEKTIGYLFHKKGKYQIELTIEDNEGNSNTAIKNWVIIK